MLNSEIDSNFLIRPPDGVNVKRQGREIFKTKTRDECTELFKKEVLLELGYSREEIEAFEETYLLS